MEHKLIQVQGGESNLPFARSRLKALRATGATHGAWRFTFPDALLALRIVEDHDYIHIGAPGCVLHMDSGVVDLFAAGSASTDLYRAGILLETDSARAYHAGHVLGEDGWRRRSDGQNQITGILTRNEGGIAGAVRPDDYVAASFAPGQVIKTQPWPHPTTPPTYETDPADGDLAEKKTVVTYCPASIFTGKCRMWVQAMYGAPLHPSSGQAAAYPRIPADITASTPSINVRPSGGDPDAPDVRITTSCGVWLDPTTGKHWLFSPDGSGNTLTVYPLVSDGCAGGLRSMLITKQANGDDLLTPPVLNALDREHLEAYVLMNARPDHANRVVVSMNRSVSAWSCGYGWHWDWTNGIADIVVTNWIGDGYAGTVESTHYRMAMTKTVVTSGTDGTKSDVWTAQVSVVEGPTRWAVLRAWFPIAFPEWLSGTLQKLTPHDSVEVSCDAPFYAFYHKDTLKVCRYKCVPTNLPANRSMSMDYAVNKAYGTTVDHLTLGERGGHLDDDGETGMHLVSTFKIGDYETRQLPRWRTRASARYRTWGLQYFGFGGGTFASPGAYTLNQQYGYPTVEAYPGSGWAINSTSGVVVTPYDNGLGQYEYWHLRHTYTEQKSSEADVVIPFYDSEAVFVRSSTVTRGTTRSFQQWKLATWSGVLPGDFVGGGSWYQGPQSIWGWNTGGVWTLNRKFQYWVPTIQANLILDYKSDVADAELTAEYEQVLVSRAGTSPAIVPSRATQQLHDNDCEEVENKFPTWSGVGVATSAIVLSPYLEPRGEVGLPEDNSVNLPTIVGWV